MGLPRRLFEREEFSLQPAFPPSCCLVVFSDQEVTFQVEAGLQSREKEAGLLMTLWSGHTSPGLLISCTLLHEKNYQPGWVLVTRGGV